MCIRDRYEYKRQLLLGYKPGENRRGRIGLPLCLNFWELYPFWHTFFTKLGFQVVHSPMSSRKLYLEGQGSIPSDTACFPAKLAHGHIEFLAKLGLDAIFYPCMTYNIDEGLGQNHYNCPVVAGYPEVIRLNTDELLEKDCTPGKLYELIRSLLADEDRRREMSRKLHTMVRLDSAERICDIVEQLTQSEK